ncbi:MAG: glycosyltransferase family 2 protein [Thermoplasmata archaeon]|nr:glycosyltransferase family 2 protein [Thermoplasmata archaeon]
MNPEGGSDGGDAQLTPRPPGSSRRSAPSSIPSLLPNASASRLVLLPTLNEEQGLAYTLSELRGVDFRAPESAPSILVIDGGSTDGTLAVARDRRVPVLQQRSRGKGAAVREGLAFARAQGFAHVALLDADGTYPVDSLPGVFDLLESGVDLVVGVRRPDRPPVGRPRELLHRLGNSLLNFAAGEFTQRPVLDICSGFWAIGLERLEELALESNGFEIESELFIKAFRRQWRVVQLPVTYRPRIGEAKLHTVRDGSRILLSILRYARSSSPGSGVLSRYGRPSSPLAAMLIGLQPERVVLLAAPERFEEAGRTAERLRAAIPKADIATAAVPAAGPHPWDPELLSGATAPFTTVQPPIEVLLPPPLEGGYREFLIEIPRTKRFVRLCEPSGAVDAEVSPAQVGHRPSPQFRRERLPVGAVTAWFILSSSFEPSWRQRELALLAANAGPARVGVFRSTARRPLGLTTLVPALELRVGRARRRGDL